MKRAIYTVSIVLLLSAVGLAADNSSKPRVFLQVDPLTKLGTVHAMQHLKDECGDIDVVATNDADYIVTFKAPTVFIGPECGATVTNPKGEIIWSKWTRTQKSAAKHVCKAITENWHKK